LSSPVHIVCLILNIFIPGLGTIIAGASSSNATKKKFNIIFGIIQFLLAIVLIGWVLSIIWGVLIYIRNRGYVGKIPDAVFDKAMK
jgi:TM2 domain-containing membrane protein YozV